MQELVPPHRCHKVRPFRECSSSEMERIASIVDGGVHQTDISQDLCFTTLYLFTCYISIDTFTIFTVTSWEEFLWARHAIFFYDDP